MRTRSERRMLHTTEKRKSNNKWQNFHKICEHNLYSLGENQTKFKSVKDLN